MYRDARLTTVPMTSGENNQVYGLYAIIMEAEVE